MRFNGLSLTTRSCGFVDIFNPALVVIARGWQELRDLINAAGAAATEGSGRKADRLTEFEFVLVHRALHYVQLRTTFGIGRLQLSASRETLLPRNCLVGRFERPARSGPNHSRYNSPDDQD